MKKIYALCAVILLAFSSCNLLDLLKTTHDIRIMNSTGTALLINITQSTSTPASYVEILAPSTMNFYKVNSGTNYVHIRENLKTSNHSISVYSDGLWEIKKDGSDYEVSKKIY